LIEHLLLTRLDAVQLVEAMNDSKEMVGVLQERATKEQSGP
jgi:hypothetical protein